MARVQFPTTFEETEDLPRSRRALQNCFDNGKNQIISRPGIASIATTSGVARGQFVWNGSLYQVSSQQLLKVTNTTTGATSLIGTIAGAAAIEWDVGFNDAVIVVKGGAIYTLSKTDTLTDISGNTNFVPCVDVTHIDGRFVYIPENGDPAFFSDVGAAGTVQTLSFFDAEEIPDLNNSAFNFKNVLYIGGTDSFELFRNTGASPNPFARISGARISSGYIGGLVDYNSTFLFIGREKDQDFGIFAIGQGDAPKISNSAIDLILTTYTNAELANAVGSRFHWRGHDIATFSLSRHTFGFVGGNWFTLDTIENGTSGRWGGGYVNQLDGIYYTAFSNKIGKLSKINSDYGEKITRIIDTGYEQADDNFFKAQSIELGISQGFNDIVSRAEELGFLILEGTGEYDFLALEGTNINDLLILE
tara:strand:- start:4835 stop:6091 length:1257 start_codon:yes stop_codon:yes gene_type:complete